MDIFEGEPTMAEGIEPSKGEVLYIGKEPIGFLFGKEPTPIILEGWISVEDRLPEELGRFICLERHTNQIYALNYIGGQRWKCFEDEDYNWYEVSHWLPFTVKMPEK